MKKIAILKQSFEENDIFINDKFFKSFFYLKHNEKEKFEFFYNFYKNFYKNPSCGKNKKNHSDNNNLYHYHSGYPKYNEFDLTFKNSKRCYPLSKNIIYCISCKDFSLNQNGKTSASVLYYYLLEDLIIFFAWGDEHVPFPKSFVFEKAVKLCTDINNIAIINKK